MKLVIPGAAGFVAVNLLQRIQADSRIGARFERIVLVDPLQYEVQKVPKQILDDRRCEFVYGSIYDPRVLSQVVGAGDVVIHLVAPVNSFTEPQTEIADDPIGYLSALADTRIGRLLFLSAADIYGDNTSADLVESDPIHPTTVYAAAKAALEAYISAFASMSGLPAVVFRPVTIYGPNQYAGWLVPRVITQAIAGEPITLTGDGSIRRDWIHVDDVCDLLIRAVHCDEETVGEIFNVGTGTEDTVLGLTRYVLERLGRSEELVNFIPDRPGDIRRQRTSAAKARARFGWMPRISLHEGLDTTIGWYQSHLASRTAQPGEKSLPSYYYTRSPCPHRDCSRAARSAHGSMTYRPRGLRCCRCVRPCERPSCQAGANRRLPGTSQMELVGLEPTTFWLPARRSPS